MLRPHWLLATVLLFLAVSCSRREPATPSAEAQPTPSATAIAPDDPAPVPPQIDACALISDEELEAITGARVESRKSNVNVSNGLRVAQCYVQMPTAADSVAFAIYQKAEVNGPNPRSVWAQTYGRNFEQEQEREEESGEESNREEKNFARPEELPGLGEKAFAVPQRFGVTIYLLSGNNFLRLSIGGAAADPREKKIAILRSIAEVLLPKL